MMKLYKILLFISFLIVNYKAGGSQSRSLDCCTGRTRNDFTKHKTLESIFVNNLHMNVQSFFGVLKTLNVLSKFETVNSMTNNNLENFIEHEFLDGFLLYFSQLLVNDAKFISCQHCHSFYFYDKFAYDFDNQARFKVMIIHNSDVFINLVYKNLQKSIRLRKFILSKFKSNFFKNAMINYFVDSNNMINECPRFDYLDFEMKSEAFLPIEQLFSNLVIRESFIKEHVQYLFDEKNNQRNKQSKDSKQINKAEQIIYDNNFDNTYDGFIFLLSSLFYFYKDNADKPFNVSLIESYLKEYLDIWSQCVVVFLYNKLDALDRWSIFYNFIADYDFEYHGSGDKEKFLVAIDDLKFASRKRLSLINKCGITNVDWYTNGWSIILRQDQNGNDFTTRRYQEMFFHEKILFDTLNEYDEFIGIYRSLNWDQLYNNIDTKVKYYCKKVHYNTAIDLSKQKTYEVCEFLSATVNSFMQTYTWKFANKFKDYTIDDGLCPKVWQTCIDRENILVSAYQNKLCATIPFAKMINTTRNYNYDPNVLNHGFLIVFFTHELFFKTSNLQRKRNNNLKQNNNRVASLTKENVENFVKTNKKTNKGDNIENFNDVNFMHLITFQYLKIAEPFYEHLLQEENEGKIDLLVQFVSLDLFAIRERFFKFFRKNYCTQDNELKLEYENGVFRAIYEYCIYSLIQLGDKRFKSCNQISQRFVRLDVPNKGAEKQVFIYFLVNNFFYWVQYFSFAEYAVCVSPSIINAVLSHIPETNHIVCPTFAF